MYYIMIKKRPPLMQKTIWLESYRNTSKIDKVMQKNNKMLHL